MVDKMQELGVAVRIPAVANRRAEGNDVEQQLAHGMIGIVEKRAHLLPQGHVDRLPNPRLVKRTGCLEEFVSRIVIGAEKLGDECEDVAAVAVAPELDAAEPRRFVCACVCACAGVLGEFVDEAYCAVGARDMIVLA